MTQYHMWGLGLRREPPPERAHVVSFEAKQVRGPLTLTPEEGAQLRTLAHSIKAAAWQTIWRNA